MRLNLDVPFVENAPDDLHCYSASLAMIVGHFTPNISPTIRIGNMLSAKEEGRAAWPLAAPLWLTRNGFDVSITFDFDYEALGRHGIEYIRSRYGDEVAKYQEENSQLPSGPVVHDFLSEVAFTKRAPDLGDIEIALSKRQLSLVTVNSSMLNGEDGYINHSVVVKGITDTGLIVHNPGLPPLPDQQVAFDDFVAAWSFPTDEARYLMTVGESADRAIDFEALTSIAQTGKSGE